MFIDKQPEKNIDYYKRLLKAIGSLSNLFSENPEPYIDDRIAENLFCKAFDAKNLSRSDASADASKNRVGLGIKTFLEGNGRTLQKVAEFNNDRPAYESLKVEAQIRKIAELRNVRIQFTEDVHGLENSIYH